MQYTIGEMSKQLGVAPSTLRYYDKEGLLPFVERSPGGMRVFCDADYETLQVIGCLKDTGMSIKDIRAFISLVMEGDVSIDARLALFKHRREEVVQQMKQLQQTLDSVDFKCWFYETAKAYGTTAIPEQMSLEELPPQMRSIRARLRKE